MKPNQTMVTTLATVATISLVSFVCYHRGKKIMKDLTAKCKNFNKVLDSFIGYKKDLTSTVTTSTSTFIGYKKKYQHQQKKIKKKKN